MNAPHNILSFFLFLLSVFGVIGCRTGGGGDHPTPPVRPTDYQQTVSLSAGLWEEYGSNKAGLVVMEDGTFHSSHPFAASSVRLPITSGTHRVSFVAYAPYDATLSGRCPFDLSLGAHQLFVSPVCYSDPEVNTSYTISGLTPVLSLLRFTLSKEIDPEQLSFVGFRCVSGKGFFSFKDGLVHADEAGDALFHPKEFRHETLSDGTHVVTTPLLPQIIHGGVVVVRYKEKEMDLTLPLERVDAGKVYQVPLLLVVDTPEPPDPPTGSLLRLGSYIVTEYVKGAPDNWGLAFPTHP